MKIIRENLGQTLSARAVAELLKLDVKTVRQYYRELGGMRLGRRYLFFERSVVNAIQKRTELDSPSAEKWKETGEGVFDEETSTDVGSQDEAKTRKRMEQEDRHGLFG
jgi:hypothetical protein